MAGSSATLHEDPERLSAKTVDRHRAIVSIMEELEAIDWYASLFTKEKVTPPSTPNDGFRQIVEAFSTHGLDNLTVQVAATAVAAALLGG